MDINEAAIWDQLKAKNEKAIDLILVHYGGLLGSIVKKHLCRFENLQDECFNDILLAVWDHADKYCPEKSTLKNWIAAIARYKAIDCKRKQLRRLPEISFENRFWVLPAWINHY